MSLTKKRLINIAKDVKTLGCSAVALVFDTLAVPVDVCRDVVNKYQANKELLKANEKTISKVSPVNEHKEEIKADIEATEPTKVSPPRKPRKKVETCPTTT